MLRTATALLVVCAAGLVGLSACEASEEGPDTRVVEGDDPSAMATPKRSPSASTRTLSSSPKPAPSPTDTETPMPKSYRPNEPLPDGAGALGEALAEVYRVLDRRVRMWLTTGGDPSARRAEEIELAALYQQRLYRKLVREPRSADAVLARLTGSLKRTATTNLRAGRRLSAGLDPVKPPIRLETAEAAAPQRLLTFYEIAERRFEVPWTVLASVNFVETRFGRILGPSSAGALGPMQFLPSTWDRYGAGGDIMDPHDAILGAARYLRASGALSDIRGALFAYNQSTDYVDSVLDYAQEMRRRPNAFYEYYFWQVFVRTTQGDVQLTGPGADVKG